MKVDRRRYCTGTFATRRLLRCSILTNGRSMAGATRRIVSKIHSTTRTSMNDVTYLSTDRAGEFFLGPRAQVTNRLDPRAPSKSWV